MRKYFILLLFVFSNSFLSFTQIPAGYYNNATGKTGEALRTALYDITRATHVKLPYTDKNFDVWDAYAYTDVKSAGSTIIWDMYSDIPNGTQTFSYTLYTNQCLGGASAEGDCYSREHCMANSYWGGLDDSKNPQYTDLHHLFACDQYVNQHKTDFLIGESNSYTYISSNGSKTGPCSYPGYTGNVFEPIDEYKGDFARAWLYLATRYKDVIGTWVKTYPGKDSQYAIDTITYNFKPWMINMLLEWHNIDPVSQKEIDRNNAIYYNTPQKNRNPYIDHPEYVCLVFGSNCDNAPVITNVINTPTTPTSSNTVSVSASITDNISVSSAVLYWDITPTGFSNSISMNVGVAPNYTISSAIPAQVSGTTVYYKIVATDNEVHTTTSSTFSYNILQGEPTNHPTGFTCGTVTSSSIALNWTDAIGTIIPNGYLVKMSSVSLADITNPVDGTPVADASNAKNILPSVQTCTFTGLNSNSTYYFKIYSYSNSGSSINYKLTATIQNTSCSTISGSVVNYTCIAEGFANGTTAPSGWTFTNINSTYTTSTSSYPTIPSLKFDATGDIVTTPTVTGASELSFWIKGYSTDALSAILVEGYNGSSWSTIENITSSIPTSGTIKKYNSSSIPALASGFTQFRFTYTKSAGNVAFDSLTVVCQSNCSVPSTQASALNFTSVTTNSLTVNWTRGSGNSVIVLAKSGSSVDFDPVSGMTYAANSVFGSGNQIGTGNYVVYDGTGTSVDITGLTTGVDYYFAVYEYTSASNCYLVPAVKGNKSTIAPLSYCTVSSTCDEYISNVSIGTINNSSTCTSGGYANYTSSSTNIVKGGTLSISVTNGNTNYPTDQCGIWVDWNNDGDFTNDAVISVSGTPGVGPYAATISCPLDAALGAKRLRVRVLYTGTISSCGATSYGEVEDYTLNVIENVCTPPSIQATLFSASSITTSSLSANWTRGNGNSVLVLAKQGSVVDTNPVNGVAYTANSIFGSGNQIGTGNYVVYNGTATSVNISNLIASTTYHFAIYEYTSATYCYKSVPLTGNATTTAQPSMTYVSSTSTQNNVANVAPNQINQEIIGISIVTNGSTSPLSATSFSFNTTGTTNPSVDILNAKLYYTGTSNIFATTAQVGNTSISPNGTFSITGNQTLLDGTNYFWLTYDVSATATLNNYLDAQCTSITVGTSKIPTVTNPTGSRKIAIEYCTAGSTATTYEYISNVAIGTVNQASARGAGGYENYTSSIANVVVGQSSNISVTILSPYSSDELLIWADWNIDGDFLDSNETIYSSGATGSALYSTTITPPTSANIGLTRMRIRLNDTASGSNSTSCGTSSWGEVEDYSLNVTCVAPLAPTISLIGNYTLHSDVVSGNQWYYENILIAGATNQDYDALIDGNYYSIVTLNNCSSAQSNTINVVSTNKEEFLTEKVKIYPNPAKDKLFIEIPSICSNVKFELSNEIGQCVYLTTIINKQSIDLSKFPSGIYFAKVSINGNIYNKKIVKY